MDYIIITAGGSGTRMGASLPKQFMELGNKPVLMHTIDKFYKVTEKSKIIVTLPESEIATWKKLCEKYKFHTPHSVVNGGKTRFHSIKNAVDSIENGNGLVAVHDGVRPFVSDDTIKRCFEMASENKTAIPVIELFDSARILKDGDSEIFDRSLIRLVQTPQVFEFSVIKEAYNLDYSENFTDDASVVESLGYKINLVEGNRDNIKITTQEDMVYAEAILRTILN